MNAQEIIDELEALKGSGAKVQIYSDGELLDVRDVTYQSSSDPDVEDAIVIRAVN